MTDPALPIALPDDCMTIITSYLGYNDIVRLSLACRRPDMSTFHLVQSLTFPTTIRREKVLPATLKLHKFNKLTNLSISKPFLRYFDLLAKSNPSLVSIIYPEEEHFLPPFGLFAQNYALPNLRTLHLNNVMVDASDFLTRLANAAPDLEHLTFTPLGGFDSSLILLLPKLRSLNMHGSSSSDEKNDFSAFKEHKSLVELTIQPWRPRIHSLTEATVAEFLHEIRAISPPGVDIRLRYGEGNMNIPEHLVSQDDFSTSVADLLCNEGADMKSVRLHHVGTAVALRYVLPHVVGSPAFDRELNVALRWGFTMKDIDYCKEIFKYLQPTKLPWAAIRGRPPAEVHEFFAWALSPELNPGGFILSSDELIDFFSQSIRDSFREYVTAILRCIPINVDDPCFVGICEALFRECPDWELWGEYLVLLIDRMNADQKVWFANRITDSHWQRNGYNGPLPYFTLILLTFVEAPATKLVSFVDEKIFHDYFVLPPAMPPDEDEEEEDPDQQQPVKTVLTEAVNLRSRRRLHLLLESKLIRSEDLNVGDPHPLQIAISCDSVDLSLLLQSGCRLRSDVIQWALGEASNEALTSLFAALQECPAQAHIGLFENLSIVYRMCQRYIPLIPLRSFVDLLKAMGASAQKIAELMNEPYAGVTEGITSVPLDAALAKRHALDSVWIAQTVLLLMQCGSLVSLGHKRALQTLLAELPAAEQTLAKAISEYI